MTVQQRNEEKLKECNVALMNRLTEFQEANDSNVTQAESELIRLHEALRAERAARAEAELAASSTAKSLAEQSGAARDAGELAYVAKVEAGEAAVQLRQMMLASEHDAQTRALACMALQRKYLLLLRHRRLAARAAGTAS